MNVLIRPLQISDACISWKWRNDPEIWQFTGSKPNKKITLDIEKKWIINALSKENEKRFAICIKETNEYIGNIQLTNIENNSAEFHIFIGEKKFWGKGVSSIATRQILNYAFKDLGLEEVYLYVNKNNMAAINSYLKNGFLKVAEKNNEIFMVVKSNS